MHRGAGAPVGSLPAKNPKQAQGSRPLSAAKQEIKVRVLAVPPFSLPNAEVVAHDLLDLLPVADSWAF